MHDPEFPIAQLTYIRRYEYYVVISLLQRTHTRWSRGYFRHSNLLCRCGGIIDNIRRMSEIKL